ncbi:MAG TPA: methyltransferase domain-containing protein [Mycobacteriales bacterium]|nr:methyltransferase domain-containing protein [Mycobacteriales bacterium]
MTKTVVNVEMAAAWDGDEGAEWARDWQRYDRAARNYHRVLLDAAAIGRTDRVLDIGCGNGESTRDAARAAADGTATGIDLSSRMVERARELATADGLTNVTFVQGDAQVHPFDPSAYDIALSRFGAMFFGDAVAAFGNIRAALAPGGRLAAIAWRGPEANEWLRCVFAALAAGRDLPAPPVGAPGPFGLADADNTRAMLSAAGFDDIEITPVDAPLWLGTDGDDAFGFFRGTGIVRGMTQELDDTSRGRALAALRATMLEHDTGDGVYFGSGAWLIAARRPGS